jgi:DNA-binding NtrC family response regulator
MQAAPPLEQSHPAPGRFAAPTAVGLGSMIGRSAVMRQLFEQMRCTARHLRIATLEGESGTGKALAVATLHSLASPEGAPFIPCSAVQFFAHAHSATQWAGAIHEARRGTLLFTHIEELALEGQSRLLQLLQWLDHQHARRAVDGLPRRLFFTSNHSLRKLAMASTLRADLANRLTAIRFAVPPLRDRRDDIPLLAESFALQFAATHNKPMRGLSPQAVPGLMAHAWPGNVRELESIIHTAALRCEGQWIRPIDIPALVPTLAPATMLPAPAEEDPNLDRAILRHIVRVLEGVSGNKLKASHMLGISRSTLYRLLESGEADKIAAAAALSA